MEDIRTRLPDKPVRLIDQIRAEIRKRNLSYATERTYIGWILRFIRFHGKQHPDRLSNEHVEAFLNHLAVNRECSVNTQKVALNALVFLFRECLRLRVKDIDFEMNHIVVRDGKGSKDRVTILPDAIKQKLTLQIEYVSSLHRVDLDRGCGAVYLPNALSRKYPRAATSIGWQYCFPAKDTSIDPRSNIERRHHILAQSIQRRVKVAIMESSIRKQASTHTFRHSFATRLLEAGYDLRTIQEPSAVYKVAYPNVNDWTYLHSERRQRRGIRLLC